MLYRLVRKIWKWHGKSGNKRDTIMSTISGNLDASNWKEFRKRLQEIRSELSGGRPIAGIISEVRHLSAMGLNFATERVEGISDSYSLMCDFLLKGYKDERRVELYSQLARKLDSLVGDMLVFVESRWDMSVSSYLSVACLQDIDLDDLKAKLEAFVSDQAVLLFEPEERRKEKARLIYDNHHKMLLSAFNRIVASRQWSCERGNDMVDLLLSPTVDTIDSMTMVSAIMLSSLFVSDAEKLMALARVYQGASDMRLRQRALVGWVFALEVTDLALYPEVRKYIEELLAYPEVCEDLMQLQMQVVYCMNAERDNETISKDVMPTIMTNQGVEWTKFGIREKEDCSMEDILHPDDAERKMEEMEKSIRKMVDMQKHGADIYFGGFSKMKRFGFFYTLSNWFTPFYKQHPGLEQLSSEMLNAGFMDAIFRSGPFCDSDKYSFALGVSSIYDRLPENIHDMLSNGSAAVEVMGTSADAETNSPVYVRRQYLQDLYRFFRINDCRSAFVDPFAEQGKRIFMNNQVFLQRLSVEARRVERFLMKHGRMGDVREMLLHYYDSMNVDDVLLKAKLEMQDCHYDVAEKLYQEALDMCPDDINAQKGYALASFHAGHYYVAATQYDFLSKKQPEQFSYKLNLAISLINDGRAEEAVRVLYELYYLMPENIDAKRALAWGQLCLKHLEQAQKLYDEILKVNEISAADYLNAGYCLWFQNRLQDAVGLFKSYIKKAGEQSRGSVRIDFMRKLDEDALLLDAYGISDVDRRIVAGMVCC